MIFLSTKRVSLEFVPFDGLYLMSVLWTTDLRSVYKERLIPTLITLFCGN